MTPMIVLEIDESIPAHVRFWTGDEVSRLVDQIRKLVCSGAIPGGSPMPQARQLATDLQLDERTVAKAYNLLQGERILQRSGLWTLIVHPNAAGSGTAPR